ncbi:MAG: YggT family protein [Pseudonocardia sp.]|nr:YggT family protein [Pseudonocardia sp.]
MSRSPRTTPASSRSGGSTGPKASLARPGPPSSALHPRLGSGTVPLVIQFVLYYVLFFFWLLLIGRIVAELVRSFARQWVPAGPSAVALELIFTATDPPVKLLRRVIPTVRIGGVGLDLSIMVLLLGVFILMSVAQPTPT